MYYTYAHTRADDGKIFYIGKGSKNRYRQGSGRMPAWHAINSEAGGFLPIKLAHWDTEEEALSHESLLIQCFFDMGYRLANQTAFDRFQVGQAPVVSNIGRKWSREAVEKRAAVLRGRKQSPEHIANALAARMANKKPSPLKGLKRSPEIVEKVRQANLGKKRSAEYRLWLSQAKKGNTYMLGKKLSPEHCKNIGLARVGEKNCWWGKFGEAHPAFKGWWITPKGKFDRLEDAAKANGLSKDQLSYRARGRHKNGKFYPPKFGFSFIGK